MAILADKITTFVNVAATKSRKIAASLIGEFDRAGYQSQKSRELLLQITTTREFLDLLNTTARGGMTEKEINNLIDFYYWWLDLYHIVIVNYTNYSMPVDGQKILVPSNYYALEAAVQTEITTRANQVAALDAKIGNLTHLVISKTAHGFLVKDVLTINVAGVLVKVSDPANEKRIGLVIEVTNPNTFRLALSGYVTGLSALNTGSVYYAQANGVLGLTVTEMAVLVASSVTEGYMLPQGYLNELRSDNAVAVSGASITLDMLNFKKRSFKAAATITAPKTWVISNAGNAKKIEAFVFTLTGLHAQTMPVTVKMPDPRLIANVWTPDAAGDYVMTGKYDGVTWWMEINGPFI